MKMYVFDDQKIDTIDYVLVHHCFVIIKSKSYIKDLYKPSYDFAYFTYCWHFIDNSSLS